MSKTTGAQQYPSNVLKITIDNLSNKAFGARLSAGEKVEDEMFESRKKKIISKITLTNGMGRDVQLTEFDRAVFDGCISEQTKGNELITPSIINSQKNSLASPVRATPRTVAINHYLLRRSLEIKGSKERSAKNKHFKPLRKIITLQDMCEKCGIPFDDKSARQDARGSATKILKFLMENKIIKNFHFEKKDGKIYSVVIDV